MIKKETVIRHDCGNQSMVVNSNFAVLARAEITTFPQRKKIKYLGATHKNRRYMYFSHTLSHKKKPVTISHSPYIVGKISINRV